MELRQYLTLIRRWWWLLLILTLLGASAAVAASFLTAPAYEASTSILINQAPGSLPSAEQVLSGQRVAATYSELLHQRPVLEEVISTLSLAITPEELDKQIQVVQVRDTNILKLTIRDSDPQRAADIANKMVVVFVQQNLAYQQSRYAASIENLQAELNSIQGDIEATNTKITELQQRIAAVPTTEDIAERDRMQVALTDYQGNYASLLKQFEDIRLAQAQNTDKLTVVESAIIGQRVSLSALEYSLLGGILGLMLGVSAILIIEYLNDAVRSPSEIEQIAERPMLGIIASFPRSSHPYALIVSTAPRSPISESYRVMRANLEFLMLDKPLRSLLVTSPGPGDGKSSTSANLALTFAQLGKKVILIDLDLRKPTLHRYFNLPNRQGVSNAFLQDTVSLTGLFQETGIENLSLLSSGPLPPNPADLLHSIRTQRVLQALMQQADMLVIDTPPVMAVADPTLLAQHCDASMLVVRSDKTRSGSLRAAVEQLSQSGANLLGIVLNGTGSTDGYYYNYQYQYRYYGRHQDSE